ncbi:MAG: hypothetical protein PVH88_12680 [Ignavibacteria bacterium]|jgi:translation initiation factor 2B subunit (eIF-2B alpha/beta/delta family)
MQIKADDELSKILSDNISGSIEINLKLNNYLKKNFLLQENKEEFILFLQEKFSTFQTIVNYLQEVYNLYYQPDHTNLKLYFYNFESDIENVYLKIFRKFFPLVKNVDTFLTFSNSNTLLRIFEMLNKEIKEMVITVCESRPVLEGRTFCKKLIDLNISTRLTTEAMSARDIEASGAVVVGADKILSNGDVINKIGTKQLAILCRYFRKPFYVLADKSKISNSNEFNPKEYPSVEIWNDAPIQLQINNIYFERVDKDLITNVITD